MKTELEQLEIRIKQNEQDLLNIKTEIQRLRQEVEAARLGLPLKWAKTEDIKLLIQNEAEELRRFAKEVQENINEVTKNRGILGITTSTS